jgi:hypothetical protein
MKYINFAQICSIEVYKKQQYFYIQYTSWKEKNSFISRILGNTPIIKYGFAEIDGYLNSKFYTIEEAMEYVKTKNLYIHDRVVYRKPYIKIKMSNNNSIDKSFETMEELETYINKVKNIVPTIKVLNL